MPLWLEKPAPKAPQALIEELRQSGFVVRERADGTWLVLRERCAALVAYDRKTGARILRAGKVLSTNELGLLVDLGYQKCWEGPSGYREPACAEDVAAYHSFLESLRTKLRLPALYNQSLGSENYFHKYDGLESAGRDPAQSGECRSRRT